MSNVLENITTRRSVRAYQGTEVPEEDVKKLVEAGLYAPSARNIQNWQITVVQGKEKLDPLRRAVAQALSDPEYHGFYQAPLFMIVTVPRDYRFGASDCACVLENIFLAANDLGLGSVWINQLADVCDVPVVRKVLTGYGIPEEHVNYGCAAVGYPAGTIRTERENKGKVVYA